MSSLYLDPEDLINLIAEEAEFKQEQIHFHITYYEGIAKIHKKNEAILALAACTLLGGKLQHSQEIIKNYAETANPNLNYLYNFLLGLINEKQESPQNAIENYISASQHRQIHIKKPFLLQTRLLNCYLVTQNYSQAIEFFSNNHSFPVHLQDEFYCQLAYCCEQLGDKKGALDWYGLIKTTDSPLSQASSIWCAILKGEGKCEEIEEFIKKNTENKFEVCDWKYILSQFYIRKGEFDLALEILKEITEVSKRDVYFSALGLVYLKKNCIVQAFVSYLRALRFNKAVAENWFNLALVYYKVNQGESADAMSMAKGFDKSRMIEDELGADSEVINVNFDFSLFGKPPVVRKIVKKKPATVKKVNTAEVKPQEVIIPTAIGTPFPIPFPNFPMNAFYENLMRFMNTSMQGRPFMGMPQGFNFFYDNRPAPVKTERVSEPELPVKRKRDSKNKKK